MLLQSTQTFLLGALYANFYAYCFVYLKVSYKLARGFIRHGSRCVEVIVNPMHVLIE